MNIDYIIREYYNIHTLMVEFRIIIGPITNHPNILPHIFNSLGEAELVVKYLRKYKNPIDHYVEG